MRETDSDDFGIAGVIMVLLVHFTFLGCILFPPAAPILVGVCIAGLIACALGWKRCLWIVAILAYVIWVNTR